MAGEKRKTGDGEPVAEAGERIWSLGDGSALEELLAEGRLENCAYPKIFARGRDYASDGRVGGLRLEEWGFEARVSGGGDEPYSVRVRAEKSDRGTGAELTILECDCPWGADGDGDKGACKHVIAASLVAWRAYATDREAEQIASEMASPEAAQKKRARI